MYSSLKYGALFWDKGPSRLWINLAPLPPWLREEIHVDFERRQEAILGSSDGKVSAYNVGDQGLIPRLGRSPGEGNGTPLQYPCLENPRDRGASWATVHVVAKSQTQLSDLTFNVRSCLCSGNSAVEILDHVWKWGHRNIFLLGISSYCHSNSTNNWDTVLEQVYSTDLKGRDAVSWLYHSKMPIHSWAGLWRPVLGPYWVPSSPGLCGQMAVCVSTKGCVGVGKGG